MKEALISKPSKHIVWLDVVRLVAMFTVVCCHSADPFNFYAGDPTADIGSIKYWGAVYGSLLRPCVLGFEPDVILTFFPYAGEDVTRQALTVSLGYIGQIPMNFSVVDVHMWYIYLLIGLYLYMPIFSAWVEKASEKAKLWFLLGWSVTLFVPYLREYVNPYIWGACSWNEFYMLYYFAGFNGYLLLGHYLRHHDWSLSKILLAGIPMFVVGFGVTFAGFRHITSLPEFTEEQLELFFYYCSPNVVMMTIPIFLLCKKVEIRSVWIQKALANLTVCGFGVYMIHYFFTGPSVALMRTLHIPICLQIPLAAVLAFAVSWALVLLIRRLTGKTAKYWVG